MNILNHAGMMKLALCITLACGAAPLFGLPELSLSAGGGGIFNLQWKDAVLKDIYRNYTGGAYGHGISAPTEPTTDAMRQGLFNTKDLTAGGGVYGFFDATYAEGGVALIFNRVSQTVAIPNQPDISPSMQGSETYNYLFTQINLSLLLKYPFSLGERWRLFPLLGIDGQIALGDYDDKMKEDFKKVRNLGYDMPNVGEFWNALWIRAGAGADFNLTEKLYLRCEALYGVKVNSKYETDMADYWTDDLKGITSGINIRLGIGYTFKKF